MLNGFDLNQDRFRYDIGLNGLPTDLNSSTLKLKPGSQWSCDIGRQRHIT
jgi:hypothetical protein